MKAPRRFPKLAAAVLLFGLPAAALFSRPALAQDDQGGDTAPPPPPTDQDDSAPPPAEALPPQQAPDEARFDQALTPYGHWVDTPEYGRVWVPNAASNPDWQPYTDGSWVYTDSGWAFASDVPWGWAAFHYGRWAYGDVGWYWVPGYTWAPAWVSWRYTNGHVAWAPYGPRGFSYGSRWHGWGRGPGAALHPPDRARAGPLCPLRIDHPRRTSRAFDLEPSRAWADLRAAPRRRWPGPPRPAFGARAPGGCTSSRTGSRRAERPAAGEPAMIPPLPRRCGDLPRTPQEKVEEALVYSFQQT